LRVGIATGPVVLGDLLGDGTDQHGIVAKLPACGEPRTLRAQYGCDCGK
jgi:hypothetical protein